MTTTPERAAAVPLHGISSMATRALLQALCAAWRAAGGREVEMLSIGGVDAARRVEAGEAFDVVVLASDALEKLAAAGRLQAGSVTPLVRSDVAIAVRAGAPRPEVGSEAALRAAMLAAPTIGYSTGPSGTALVKLIDRWGLADTLKPRLVQATPGVPVGSMVAGGQVALGFQQYSELKDLEGIDILGPMPEAVAITTVFAGAVCATATHPDDARALLAFMADPARAELKHAHGMAPA